VHEAYLSHPGTAEEVIRFDSGKKSDWGVQASKHDPHRSTSVPALGPRVARARAPDLCRVSWAEKGARRPPHSQDWPGELRPWRDTQDQHHRSQVRPQAGGQRDVLPRPVRPRQECAVDRGARHRHHPQRRLTEPREAAAGACRQPRPLAGQESGASRP
jgi:hypothetical protein